MVKRVEDRPKPLEVLGDSSSVDRLRDGRDSSLGQGFGPMKGKQIGKPVGQREAHVQAIGGQRLLKR
jgi:hypothetical protein